VSFPVLSQITFSYTNRFVLGIFPPRTPLYGLYYLCSASAPIVDILSDGFSTFLKQPSGLESCRHLSARYDGHWGTVPGRLATRLAGCNIYTLYSLGPPSYQVVLPSHRL
jgi:hypothetical protein